MLLEQSRAHLVVYLRSPFYGLFSLALPLIFWVFFGLPRAHTTMFGVNGGAYLLASFGAYGVGNTMLFTFGIGIAMERGRKQDLLMRATPLRPGVHLLSRLVATAAFAMFTLVVLAVVASITGGVRLPAEEWVALVWRVTVGALPLFLLGLALGYLVSDQAAPSIVNLVGLPMFLASGMIIPIGELPGFIQTIAPYLPAYRYAQLAWGAVGARADPVATDLLWLAGYGAVFLAVALRAYRIEESRKFI
jgi:ABC-2 type transport system permease protein